MNKLFRLIQSLLRLINSVLSEVFMILGAPLLFLTYLVLAKRRRQTEPRLVWGIDPLISNKYWSEALKEAGYHSTTLMSGVYAINKTADFDIYFDSLFQRYLKVRFVRLFVVRCRYYLIFLYSLKHFDIFHIPLHGFVLRFTFLKFQEAQLLKFAGKKVIVLPYGGDFYRYSEVDDVSLRHALLKSYPDPARNEYQFKKQLNYWVRRADIFLPTFQVDSVGRWDLFPFSALSINTDAWPQKSQYSNSDGTSGSVKIIHTPNHRGFKGTEFIIQAIRELKDEGLKIDFILVEKRTNDEVKSLMQNADILVEQIVATAYALSGIEGMVSGLPVLSNLDNEFYTRAFRRYSFLNECPILSTTPENVTANLRLLVTNPGLRKELGMAGRAYVQKYHSYQASQFMFGNIYDKIWRASSVDLMNMYDPSDPNSYNRRFPLIQHPLKENRLQPGEGFSTAKH